jgi:hypothetical protein
LADAGFLAARYTIWDPAFRPDQVVLRSLLECIRDLDLTLVSINDGTPITRDPDKKSKEQS